MKKRQELSREQKRQICKERFEEGKSTNELAKKHNVCQRTIIRISNVYRADGAAAFEPKVKKAKPEETLEEKVKRLEKENEFLRMIQKELLPYAKKK